MSPLACSLLALAALLAAADAIMPNPCTTKVYDKMEPLKSAKLHTIRFKSGGGIIRARENACRNKFGPSYSSTIHAVTACNDVGYAPKISRAGSYTFYIECEDGCESGGFVDIVDRCFKLNT